MDKYENHRDEWREEDAKCKAGYVEEDEYTHKECDEDEEE